MLNLGCGYRMHWEFNNIDSSPFVFFAKHPSVERVLRSLGFISEERHQKHLSVDPGILNHDLRKGIPFPDSVFDVVYHSHVLEHIDIDSAPVFLGECRRVLKKNGVMRVVVPDLEGIIGRYNSTMRKIDGGDSSGLEGHLASIHELFDMMVRFEKMVIVRNRKDRLLHGAKTMLQTGGGHRWMYDRHSLKDLLGKLGFSRIKRKDAFSSGIPGWNRFGLDVVERNKIYRPHSLYMEALKV